MLLSQFIQLTMSKTLGGFLFIKDGIKFDYNFKETIECLLEFCDEVVCIDVGSTDETAQVIRGIKDNKLIKIFLPGSKWEEIHGREKLAHFQNMAAEFLSTDYQFLLQADEVVDPSSYPAIRAAIETGKEGFMGTRINLWGSPGTYLTVPQNRMPCSPQVVRLTKVGYKTYDDGENIGCNPDMSLVDDIVIWHYGFVRKKEVMKAKIINMQESVFEIDHDPKLDGMEIFDSTKWFNGDDLAAITRPHPPIMKQWVAARL